MMAPKLKAVSGEYAGEVATYRVQVDTDDPLLETYDVEAMPTILFFRDGALADRVEGSGPFGYQPDVLSAVPGEEGYSPLHEIYLVHWKEGAEPRELRTVAAIEEAQANGELTIEATGTVVNAPVLAWPGGHRCPKITSSESYRIKKR